MPYFKYIILEDNQGFPHLRIFDGLSENHADVKASMPEGWIILGAGAFRCEPESMEFTRGSISLGIPQNLEKSRADTATAKRLYNAV